MASSLIPAGAKAATDAARFSSIADPNGDPHLNGEYFKNHPTWHVEFSPWKAENIHNMCQRHKLQPKTMCEVGCGAGEVLRRLQMKMDPACEFWGYDVAPPAIEMAKKNENGKLHFDVADFGELEHPVFDMLLILEVVDHVEDYMGFLRMLKNKAHWKLFSFSLDISVQSALRTGAFTQRRKKHTHLHHFNKETAIGTLEYAGFEIVDYCYPAVPPMTKLAKLGAPVRRGSFRLAPELSVRLFGGHSLLVLTK